LTNEEQQQLLKLLPVVDTAKLPDRLEFYSFICSSSCFSCNRYKSLQIPVLFFCNSFTSECCSHC